MKKIIYTLFLLLTALTVCFAFTGCEKATETSSNASTEIAGTNSGTGLQGDETGVSEAEFLWFIIFRLISPLKYLPVLK